MGCDIHLIVEAQRADGTWRYIQPPERLGSINPDAEGQRRYREWYGGRNYSLFAILADVRNFGRGKGYGEPGWDTPSFQPISAARGWPDDLSPEGRELFHLDDDWYYHSPTWYTVQELLDWDWDKQAGIESGWVGSQTYQEWKAGEPPSCYSGKPLGPNIVHVSHEQMDAWLDCPDGTTPFTVLQWPLTYRQCADGEFLHLLGELSNGRFNDRIRLVMAFDN